MDCFVYKRILYIVGFPSVTSIIHIIVYPKEEISVKIFFTGLHFLDFTNINNGSSQANMALMHFNFDIITVYTISHCKLY